MTPWLSFVIIYAVAWWMVLFMVLPFGVQNAETPGENEYAAAPIKANIKRKLWLTTWISLVPALIMQWGLYHGLFKGVI